MQDMFPLRGMHGVLWDVRSLEEVERKGRSSGFSSRTQQEGL